MKIKLINREVNANLNWQNSDKITIYGMSQKNNLRFRVNNKLPLDIKKITFVHELIHMMDMNPNIKDLSESQTEQIANEMLYFLQHNKGVLKWLMK